MSLFQDIASKMLKLGPNGSMDPKDMSNLSDQSNDDRKIISFVESKLEEARGNGTRQAAEGQWYTNIAYLLGYDSVYYNTRLRVFQNTDQTNRPMKRNRLHANKILPTIQNRTARLCKSPPKYEARPNSSSTEDKDAARLGLEVIDMIWDKQKINEKRIQATMWLQECGHSYMKVCWDDTLGKELVLDGQIQGYEGDIRIDIKSAFQIYPDTLATTLDECSSLIEVNVRKLEYFRTTYPEKGHLVKEEGPSLLSVQYQLRVNSLASGTQGNAEESMKNAAIEKIYYEKKSRDYPRGRKIVIANGVLLKDDELPCGEMPFVKFDDVLIAGKYYSEPIINQMRPLQDQLTRILTKRAQYLNVLLAGKYAAPKGHGMIKEALNDQSGEVLEYNPQPGAKDGGAPVALQIPTLPQYAYTEEDKLQSAMYDIAGINEVSRGQIPAAGIPALGMQILQEQDETRMGIMTEQHEHSYSRLGQLILMYIGDYYKTPRLLKVAGDGLEYTVKDFTGADLKGNYDVIVKRGSTIPNSKTLKRQDIINAYQQGLLGDPNDPELRQQVLSMLEFGDESDMWQDYAIDMAQAKRIIKMIEEEQVPTIDIADNQKLIYRELNNYRKSDKFLVLSPYAQAILQDTMEQCIAAKTHLMNPTLKMQTQLAEDQLQSSAPDQAVAGAIPSPQGQAQEQPPEQQSPPVM